MMIAAKWLSAQRRGHLSGEQDACWWQAASAGAGRRPRLRRAWPGGSPRPVERGWAWRGGGDRADAGPASRALAGGPVTIDLDTTDVEVSADLPVMPRAVRLCCSVGWLSWSTRHNQRPSRNASSASGGPVLPCLRRSTLSAAREGVYTKHEPCISIRAARLSPARVKISIDPRTPDNCARADRSTR